MRTYKVDLHNHTPLIPNDYRGDLNTSARDIVEAALAKGLDVLAVSDHYSVDYFGNVSRAAKEVYASTGRKLLVLPASELKITWRGDEAHLITIFPPEKAEACFEALMDYLGVSISARITEQLPMISVEADPVVVVKKVRSLGGMCHVAHVDRFFGDYRLMDRPILDQIIREAPIAAVEIVDAANSKELRRRTNGTRHIQSSDSHSPAEIGRRFTELAMEDLSFEGLRSALCAHA